VLANLAPLFVFNVLTGLICPAVFIGIALLVAFRLTRDTAREPEQPNERGLERPDEPQLPR